MNPKLKTHNVRHIYKEMTTSHLCFINNTDLYDGEIIHYDPYPTTDKPVPLYIEKVTQDIYVGTIVRWNHKSIEEFISRLKINPPNDEFKQPVSDLD